MSISKNYEKLKVVTGIMAGIAASVLVVATAFPAKAEEPTVDAPAVLVQESEGYFPLSQFERSQIERTVYAEAGNQTFVGQMAVAQCILDACEKEGKSPVVVLNKYGYNPNAAEYFQVTDSVKDAVSAVFEDGYKVTKDNILWFYNPALCVSEWHEQQRFVIELGAHRFFAEVEE